MFPLPMKPTVVMPRVNPDRYRHSGTSLVGRVEPAAVEVGLRRSRGGFDGGGSPVLSFDGC
jgi:hypothetical protein